MFVSVAEGARRCGMRRSTFERFIKAGYLHLIEVPYSLVGANGTGRRVDTEEIDVFMRGFRKEGEQMALLP